jgi:hypothetical protein
MKQLDLKTENEISKSLLKDGVFYINYWSTDCDGCSSGSHKSFKDLESFIQWVDGSNEDCEGSWGWELTDKFNLEEYEPRGYWGM